MADWTEHVPGVLWSQPVEQDSLSVKAGELGITPLDPVVVGFPKYRLIGGVHPEQGFVILAADAEDNFSLFRGRPV
jgi:hypothetical protein